eukprot:NODE_1942_length_692_cov_37.856637_g1892_i0.p1 GENE.NODE_1942_length_692_cov_37.856637_g1892_i0~~NODE_1942_length_692_cov_37.856637_g1892_i0.p1  ORF type:complete len:155 (+),score=18.93 NODE_1942_length_692_cov_37.856637_g1892_i0:192-656(+)
MDDYTLLNTCLDPTNTAGKQFSKFCVRFFCLENLLFVRDCDRYRRMPDLESRKELLQHIRSAYLMPEAPFLVNLTTEQYEDVKRKTELEDSAADPDVLVTTRNYSYELMLQDTIPRFRVSRELKQVDMGDAVSRIDLSAFVDDAQKAPNDPFSF